MRYGDLNLEIFPAESSTAVPVEFRITEEKSSEYMALAMGKYCVLNFRITELATCSIWHTRFLINEKMKLRVTGDIPCTFLWVVWKNTLYYSIQKAHEQRIMSDYYNLYHLPDVEWELSFRHPGEYETFNVLFTDFNLEEWENSHISPDFPAFLDKLRKDEIALLCPVHRRLTRGLRHAVSDLIRGPVDPVYRYSYYEDKIMDLVFHVVRDMTKSRRAPKTSLHPLEIERLYELRNTIIEHPENTYQLKELARTAGMNATKLEHGFKQLFNTTIFGLIREQRMHRALRLLRENTYAVKEVAALTGYKNPSNFTQSFTKYFGYPPRQAGRQ